MEGFMTAAMFVGMSADIAQVHFMAVLRFTEAASTVVDAANSKAEQETAGDVPAVFLLEGWLRTREAAFFARMAGRSTATVVK
jgi:hypothetical protein